MDQLEERLTVSESKVQRLERELHELRAEVARLAAWIEGKGSNPAGANESAAGPSKCAPEIKVEPGNLVIPKRKKAAKKGEGKAVLGDPEAQEGEQPAIMSSETVEG